MSHAPIVFDPDLPDVSTGQSIVIADAIFTALIIISTGTRIVKRTVRKYSQYNILFAILSLWAVKISICFFILGLIRDTHSRSRRILYGLITVTTLGSLIQSVFWGTQAKPLEKLWNPEIPGTYASPQTLVITISLFTAIFSITDLFYAVSPIYFFGRLQMDRKKKLIVLGLTGSGLLVFAVSIVRVAYVKSFFAADFTWALPKVYLFTIFERNLAELIADLPAVYPEICRRYRQLNKLRKAVWPSERNIDSNHPALQNDSECAIVTIGSRETRPPGALQLSEFSKHGENKQSSGVFREGVEQIV
ncbi:hypothetical protein F5B21DRAFT_509398 [Xylaria acuta]|nr:hypothetical protein F5B21DRAFT_509398 [Xylaria acuta]